MARQRTFDEAAVVAVARDRFWRGGYAATSVDDLVRSTGLGKGSLYSAFGDKHSLYVRALSEYCAAVLDRVTAQLQQTGVPAGDRLAAHVRAMAAEAVDPERRGCMLAKSAAERGGVDPDVDRIVGATLAQWRDELVDCVIEAQADGAIGQGIDPRALATALLAQIRGFEVLGKAGVAPADVAAAAEQALALTATQPA